MHFSFGGGSKVKPDIEIVGIVKDVKQDHVSSAIYPYVYIPYSQRPKVTGMTFYVRTTQDPVQLGTALQSEVRQMDPNLPVYDLKTMERVLDETCFDQRGWLQYFRRPSPRLRRFWRRWGSTACSRMWSYSARGRLAFAWRWAR